MSALWRADSVARSEDRKPADALIYGRHMKAWIEAGKWEAEGRRKGSGVGRENGGSACPPRRVLRFLGRGVNGVCPCHRVAFGTVAGAVQFTSRLRDTKLAGATESAPRSVGFLFARHVLVLESESLLRAVVSGTARLGQGVHREVKSEGSRCQNSDLTNRNRIQGRSREVTRQWTGTPDAHLDARRVNPARPEGRCQDLI